VHRVSKVKFNLTLWRPLLPYGLGTAIKHPVPDRVKPSSSFVIFDIRALWRSVLYPCGNNGHQMLTKFKSRDYRNMAKLSPNLFYSNDAVVIA